MNNTNRYMAAAKTSNDFMQIISQTARPGETFSRPYCYFVDSRSITLDVVT